MTLIRDASSASTSPALPGPGCRPRKDTTQTGLEHVEHEGIQPHQNTDDRRHGDGQGQQQHGIGRSIWPGTDVPPTVLVADMVDGSLFLRGWRDGPTTYLSPDDAVPLRRELAAGLQEY